MRLAFPADWEYQIYKTGLIDDMCIWNNIRSLSIPTTIVAPSDSDALLPDAIRKIKKMKDIVNTKIKFREPFRPFAPAVLADASEQYFDLPEPDRHMAARFMLLVVPVHEDKQDVIPAVNHLGTARIQTVYRDTSPFYHRLIEGFGEATGVPVLLNTSFNVRGEPIVNTPEDALNTFANSGIDSLILGNFVIDKP